MFDEMGKNRKYLLRRIVEIQKIVLEFRVKGHFYSWIYENHIRDKYHISKSTFNNYMAINAKKELKLLNQGKDEIK